MITQDELSIVVSVIEKHFPGSVEPVEMLVQYMAWRNDGISHEHAIKQLHNIMHGSERHIAEDLNRARDWKKKIETR